MHTDNAIEESGETEGIRRWADRGASIVEYALLVALIALVCVVAVTTLGTNLSDKMWSDAEKLEQAGT